MESLAGSALATQQQVTSLMEHQELLDRSDYRGYIGTSYEESIYTSGWDSMKKKKQKMLKRKISLLI